VKEGRRKPTPNGRHAGFRSDFIGSRNGYVRDVQHSDRYVLDVASAAGGDQERRQRLAIARLDDLLVGRAIAGFRTQEKDYGRSER
jgi:hypothetical protein